MSSPTLFHKLMPAREDLIRAVVLAIFTILIWCVIYNRTSAENWRIPLAYTSEPDKGDILSTFATVRAAKDGHNFPFLFKYVPELGAPYVANWNDWPSPEVLLFTFAGMIASVIGVFAAVNFAVMMAQVLAALSFYTACRLCKCSWVWSFAGGLVFAFARYAFAHGAHHLPVTFYWHIPLYLVVCRWILDGEQINFREPRFVFAVAMGVVTGIQNPYYTNIFAQFLFFGGLIQWWRQRNWKAARPAALIIGIMAASAIVISSNTFFYHLVHGTNAGTVVRPYKWMEVYALKTVDIIIPPPDHRFPPFAAWGLGHIGDETLAHPGEVILSPGELPPSGYIGLVGLAALAWLTVISARRVLERKTLPYEALQVLWILLYSDAGGLNCLAGTLGFQLFRATTRYSIFILCVVLMYAAKRLSEKKFSMPPMVYAIAVPVVALALWDQVPPQVSTQNLQELGAQVDSDRNFTEKMEQALPENAMVFQLPIMEYPESPAYGVGSSDHLRPYLYSHHLRFAFGSDKGRPRDRWQQEMAISQLSLNEIISRLESYGFSAVYVNRNGFPDKGEGLEKAFKQLGYDVIQSDQHDLFCAFLKPSNLPILPDGGLYR